VAPGEATRGDDRGTDRDRGHHAANCRFGP
jgi:hypothetical protein